MLSGPVRPAPARCQAAPNYGIGGRTGARRYRDRPVMARSWSNSADQLGGSPHPPTSPSSCSSPPSPADAIAAAAAALARGGVLLIADGGVLLVELADQLRAIAAAAADLAGGGVLLATSPRTRRWSPCARPSWRCASSRSAPTREAARARSARAELALHSVAIGADRLDAAYAGRAGADRRGRPGHGGGPLPRGPSWRCALGGGSASRWHRRSCLSPCHPGCHAVRGGRVFCEC